MGKVELSSTKWWCKRKVDFFPFCPSLLSEERKVSVPNYTIVVRVSTESPVVGQGTSMDLRSTDLFHQKSTHWCSGRFRRQRFASY